MNKNYVPSISSLHRTYKSKGCVGGVVRKEKKVRIEILNSLVFGLQWCFPFVKKKILTPQNKGHVNKVREVRRNGKECENSPTWTY